MASGSTDLWFDDIDVPALSALQLATCAGRSSISLPLHGYDLQMNIAALLPAARYVCWPELRIFASGSDLKMNIAAMPAPQIATFVGTIFVPLPLV